MNYLVFVLALLLVAGSSCYHRKVIIVNNHPGQRLPPGQAKKLTGEKSARAYAPGQQKKH